MTNSKKKYDETLEASDGSLGGVVTDTISGFNRYNQYSGSVNLSTNIYGTFNFKKGRLNAIRHTMTPSVSWIYTPDHAARHEINIRENSSSEIIETYTPFDHGIYGAPSSGISNSIGINLKND